MSDPYKVLGISRDATDDEVKKAYRDMSRKYHPDANINNPNKDKAEEMFKLVGQAYNQIMDERKNGGAYGGAFSGSSNGGYGGNPFGGFGDFGSFGGQGGYGNAGRSYSQDDSYYTAAANYINNRHFEEALNVLKNIDNRTAQWYFLSALANNGLGNNILALDLAKTARDMEPNNPTYNRLVETLESGGVWYNEQQTPFGGNSGAMCCGDPCTTLCLMNMCCGC